MSVIRLQVLLLSLSSAMDKRPELHDELIVNSMMVIYVD